MKAVHSEEYYRQYWNEFLKRVPGEDFRNLEAELETAMSIYKGSWVTDNVKAVLERVEAQKIADSCEALVRKEMKTLKDVKAGKAGLGFTTRNQEIQYEAEFVRRFEFNCLQLRDFREKYLSK